MRHGLLALLIVAACTPAMPLDRSESVGSKTTVDVVDVPAKGFPVDLEHATGSQSGELLAVDACNAYVLHDDVTIAVASDTIRKASIEVYPGKGGLYGVWTGLGAASTASHGFLLVFTLPVWLAVGIPSTVSTGNANDIQQPHGGGLLYQYARFPQGLPPQWRVDRRIGAPPGGCAAPPPSPAIAGDAGEATP
jgi:hypothetical protein